jgi:hypothetical protein
VAGLMLYDTIELTIHRKDIAAVGWVEDFLSRVMGLIRGQDFRQ